MITTEYSEQLFIGPKDVCLVATFETRPAPRWVLDGTSEGMAHSTLPVFSVQHHPEASAGPHDSRYLFERFRLKIMERKEALSR